jgi:transcriptional antiterminator RfaH
VCVVSTLSGESTIIESRSPAWYALSVKRNNERHVVEQLTSKSIPAFLPLIELTRTRKRRHRPVLEPLFPGYLFIRMECIEENPRSWHAVRWTPGVLLVLGTEGIPTPIATGVVEAIHERVSERGYVRPGIPFHPHARVRFRSGVLVGLDALFEGPTSRSGRVRVLMSLLGRQTGIEVDLLDLECA